MKAFIRDNIAGIVCLPICLYVECFNLGSQVAIYAAIGLFLLGALVACTFSYVIAKREKIVKESIDIADDLLCSYIGG